MVGSGLSDIARAMIGNGKGILAADESSPTMAKRLTAVGVESTVDARRAYRGALFSAPGIEDYIGGVILYDETLRQESPDGTPFAEVLTQKGIVPGIKVDAGTVALPGFPEQTVTEGLDGLGTRLEEYQALGAQFAKWRAVIRIGEDSPSRHAVMANAHALARYAAVCQSLGMVPIVEPEVLMDGSHGATRCADVTRHVLQIVFSELADADVRYDGLVLKPNMVLPGADASPISPEDVAMLTLEVFADTVPASVPGIAFLSGGQSEREATANLNAINACQGEPWELSYSFGRALQASALSAWSGRPEQLPAAQTAFIHRARMNRLARFGAWTLDAEEAADLEAAAT